MPDEINIDDTEATEPTQTIPPSERVWNWLRISDESWFDRLFVSILVLIQGGYTIWRFILGDWLTVGVSVAGMALLLVFAGFRPIQKRLLGRYFTRSHAFYLMIFWIYSQLFIIFFRIISDMPSVGKDSESYYIFLLIFLAITFRLLLSLYAITPLGYRVFISRIPLWEQVIVTLNEFISASIFAFVFGRLIARFLQPDIFTLEPNLYYNAGLLFLAGMYYVLMQAMWVGVWNRWLSGQKVWVNFARLFTPIALVIASIVIVRHFTNLSDLRTANLLGDATLDETILALSPILWMMVFFILVIVYSSGRGLRRMLIPNKLMEHLPVSIARPLRTISDMDILLVFAVLATVIPVQIFLFNNNTLIGQLQDGLRDNAIIDSSEQALALIFGLPFYFIALILMILYALVISNTTISAKDRNAIVDRLPLTMIMMFIITLYLAAIPFSQVLISGSIPNFQQDLGYILAFDVLIPLVLFYAHYYLLIRLPYGRGQSRWREQYAVELETHLATVDKDLSTLEKNIDQCEVIWNNRNNIQSTNDEQIGMLFDLIELNGQRDRLNMERLQVLSERQELQDVSDAPISLTIASMPSRIIQYGIPLVLIFKIYEWAIVNDGLREVADNPNIGILEFFQTILENTNF